MKRRFAEKTEVSIETSRSEIERIVIRYGAEQFVYAKSDAFVLIVFRAHQRHVRFKVPMPLRSEFENRSDKTGPKRTETQVNAAHEQELRRRWRALALAIKAKLESVSSGITQFEEEFYAHIVLPTGRTIYEETAPGVQIAYEQGRLPPLLPHFGE